MADLRSECDELAKDLRERDALDVKIARHKKRIAALVELCDESEFGEQPFDFDLGGLTDVCRTAMRASRKEWMTTAEIQSAVRELGFPLHKYKAPAASITTTVNRMLSDGEVVIDKRPTPGANEYKYVGLGHKLAGNLAEALRAITEAMNKSITPTAQEAALAQAKALVEKRGMASTILASPISRQGQQAVDKAVGKKD